MMFGSKDVFETMWMKDWATDPAKSWVEAWTAMFGGWGANAAQWPFSAMTEATSPAAAQAPHEAAASMFTSAQWPMGPMREPSNAFETWLSFTPMAPFFGLRWALMDGSTFAEAMSDASKADGFGLSAQAKRERAVLNRTVVGGRVAAQSGGAPAPAPTTEKRAPRLRVVEGGAEKAKAAEATSGRAATEAAKLANAGKTARKRAQPTPAKPDDLTAIKGVGPKLAGLLNDLGVTRFAELAAMSEAEFEALDEKLGAFRGRWKRDDWAGQAASLAK